MFLFPKKKKTALVTIHGFGKQLQHEFDPFVKYLSSKKLDIIQFNLYDLDNPDDADYRKWIRKAESQVQKAISTHDEVILLGFSMGGVIASYLASLFKVKQLILVAPAFQYLDLQKISQQGIKAIKKISKKEKEVPSSKQTKAFTEIVSKYKESISQVSCPTLILHGTKDEVIPIESSKSAYKKLTGTKRLIFIEDGKHRMLYDGKLENTCFSIIEQAIDGKLF